jgi:hypothetical protein
MAKKNPPIPVELLLARDDGTWTTKVFEVPAWVVAGKSMGSPKWEKEVMSWAQDTIFKAQEYRGVVHIGIYCYDPDNMGSAWQEGGDE